MRPPASSITGRLGAQCDIKSPEPAATLSATGSVIGVRHIDIMPLWHRGTGTVTVTASHDSDASTAEPEHGVGLGLGA